MSKYLSLHELQEQSESSPVWVLNTSAASIQQAADVMLSIPNPNGNGTNLVVIPKTWLPVDVTKDIPRRFLVDSFEFRQALQKGHITLVTEKYAGKLLKDPDAKSETDRLINEKRQVQIATSRSLTEEQKAASSSVEAAVTMGDEFVSVAELAKQGVEEFAPGIPMQFKIWTDHLNNIKDDTKVVNEIRARRSFKRRELRFLKANLTSTKAQMFVEKALKGK